MNNALPIVHEERPHAVFGGSTAEQRLNCPGSVIACRDIPEPPPSEAALKGTMVHEYAELRLRALIKHARTGKGSAYIPHEDKFVEKIVDRYLETMWEEVLDGTVTDKIILFEAEFTIVPDVAYGFVDFCVIDIDDRGRRYAWVVDYKNGRKVVDVENNMQLAFYAVGLQRMLTDKGKPLDYVRTGIYQPNTEGETWKTSKKPLSAKDLAKYEKKFLAGIQKVVEGSTKRKAGPHCFFCKAKPTCGTYNKELGAISMLTPLDVSVKKPVFIPIEDLTEEQLVRIYLMTKEIKDYLSKIGIHLHNTTALSGAAPKDLKVVESKPRRGWADKFDSKAIEVLENTIGAPVTKAPELLAMGKVEKMLKKDQKEILADFIKLSMPKQVLVSLDDERPAVAANSGMALLDDLEGDEEDF